MFTDEATIDVQAGNGGNGTVAWHREKYVAKGGPDGGDGGRGADIYFVARTEADTLSNYASKKHYKGTSGTNGGGNNRAGKAGEDLYLDVPLGTRIFELQPDGSKEMIVDLVEPNQQVLVVKGGRGGFGNAHFTSSVRQRPDFAEMGEPGEQKQLFLELKLVADVGIIGLPSVGKSSLISVMSAAKPKIAAYEFTTLVPNLGVVQVVDRAYVVCDVPGLIEGASDGKGLGDTFLKHIERCGLLVHLLDASKVLNEEDFSAATLVHDYHTIRTELENYSQLLAAKKELVVLNKIDAIDDLLPVITKELEQAGIAVYAAVSTATMVGVQDLQKSLITHVDTWRSEVLALRAEVEAEQDAEEVVLTPQVESHDMDVYTVEVLADKVKITGKRLNQLTSMTNFDNLGAIKRWRYVLDKIGVSKVHRKHSALPLYIGDKNVTSWL